MRMRDRAQPRERLPSLRGRAEWVIAALAPIPVAVLMASFAPDYIPRVSSAPPDMLGVPLGLVVVTASLVWSLLGLAVVALTRSRIVAALALAVCTIPATVIIVYTPAIIERITSG